VLDLLSWFGMARVLAASIGVFVVVVGVWWVVRVPPPPVDDQLPIASPTQSVTTIPSGTLVVHVTGAVVAPGVFRLPAGSRVVDAVAAAGGTTPSADTVAVNFAAGLVDGAQVYIPVRGRTPTTTIARPRPGVNAPVVVAPNVSECDVDAECDDGGGVGDGEFEHREPRRARVVARHRAVDGTRDYRLSRGEGAILERG